MGPEFLVTPLHVVCVCVCYLTGTASKTVEPIRRAVSSMDLVAKKPCINWGPHPPPEGKRSFVEHDDSTMNIVMVISIIIFLCHWVH